MHATRATLPFRPSGSGRSGDADPTGSFIVRMARSDATRCLRSRRTRSDDVGTSAFRFSGTITVAWSSASASSRAATEIYFGDMRGSAPCRRVASCLVTSKDNAVPIPIILDCDPGTDDAFALLLALASPEIELLAVTVAGGNVGLECTLPNALALTALAGSNVPVFAGADRPLLGSFVNETRVHGIDGLGGIALPPGGDPAPGLAADAIRGILRHAASTGDAGRHRAGHQPRAGPDDRTGTGCEGRSGSF